MKVNNIVKYTNNIEDVISKLNNNINYFNNFGDAYIPLTLKSHLEVIVSELDKVKEIAKEKKEDNSVYLEPSV